MQYKDFNHAVQLIDHWPSMIANSEITNWINSSGILYSDWKYIYSDDMLEFVNSQDALAFSIKFCHIVRK